MNASATAVPGKIWIMVLFVFIIVLGIRLFWTYQKDGLIGDEGLSITLSAYNKYMWSDNYDSGRLYTGKEVKLISLWDNPSPLNVLDDVYRLRLDNRDPQHTNLYYSCLRLWFTGWSTGDYHEINRWGTKLNLIFFSISFVFMFKLLQLLFVRTEIVIAGLLICFLSTGSISNTLLLRPYQLQETAIIIVTYICVLYCGKIMGGQIFNRWQDVVIVSGAVAFALLSGYFAVFYVALLGGLLLYTAQISSTKGAGSFIVSVMFYSISATQILYCNYFYGMFFSDRAQEALEKLVPTNVFYNFTLASSSLVKLLYNHLSYWPLLALYCTIVLAIIFLNNRSSQNEVNYPIFLNSWQRMPLNLILLSFLWSVVVLFVAPFKILRYIMPVFPIMSISYIFVLNVMKRKLLYVSVCLTVFLLMILAISPDHIEYLSLQAENNIIFIKRPDIPVLVLTSSYWKYASIVPYFNDNQVYEFPHSVLELNKRVAQLPHAFVVLDREKYSNKQVDSNYSFLGSTAGFDQYEVVSSNFNLGETE